MQNIVIYPGTFDPLTNGHLDLIQRACVLFDRVIVAIATNSSKNPAFSLAQRVALAETVLKDYDKVKVLSFESLLVDFAREQRANIILRGLRAMSDFEYEFQLAGMNKVLDPKIETIFLTPSSKTLHISSTLVRDIAAHHGDVTQFVPPMISQALLARYS